MNYKHKKLLVLNYVMDKTHHALAHQADIVEELAKEFDSITVITGKNNYQNKLSNLEIISTNWIPDRNIFNILNFYKVFCFCLRKDKYTSIFSHMTLIQSFLILPITKILKIRHYVWYAHAKNSLYLKITSKFATNILTSTKGSCPILGQKIIYLGQAIDQNKFHFKKEFKFIGKKFIHIGRLDPSKNIDLLIATIYAHRKFDSEVNLTLIGNASTKSSENYVNELRQKWDFALNEGWLVIQPAIPREKMPTTLINYDIFIHAFIGSLDKTLLEATFVGLPVITLNKEYQNEFGFWGNDGNSLLEEVQGFYNRNSIEVIDEVISRKDLAIKNHSFNQWIKELAVILRGQII